MINKNTKQFEIRYPQIRESIDHNSFIKFNYKRPF